MGFISVCCEKIIPAKKIIGRDIQNICNLRQGVDTGRAMAAFIVAVGSQPDRKKVRHLLSSETLFFSGLV